MEKQTYRLYEISITQPVADYYYAVVRDPQGEIVMHRKLRSSLNAAIRYCKKRIREDIDRRKQEGFLLAANKSN